MYDLAIPMFERVRATTPPLLLDAFLQTKSRHWIITRILKNHVGTR